MGLAYNNHIENTNSGNVEEFTSYYKEEIMKQAALIREELAKVDENPEEISVFEQIEKSGGIISDLAMVYGYEGVEAIGNRIVEAAGNYSGDVNFGDLIIKLENATQAIEDAMSLVDERKEREVIRELSQYSNSKEIHAETEGKDENAGEDSEQEQDNVFDIREDEKLISLLSDTDGQAVEIEQQNEENDSEYIDADTILGEHYTNVNFDIPTPADTDSEVVDEIIDSDVLEIDFTNNSELENESEGLFKKLGSLFGKKHKNRISYQD